MRKKYNKSKGIGFSPMPTFDVPVDDGSWATYGGTTNETLPSWNIPTAPTTTTASIAPVAATYQPDSSERLKLVDRRLDVVYQQVADYVNNVEKGMIARGTGWRDFNIGTVQAIQTGDIYSNVLVRIKPLTQGYAFELYRPTGRNTGVFSLDYTVPLFAFDNVDLPTQSDNVYDYTRKVVGALTAVTWQRPFSADNAASQIAITTTDNFAQDLNQALANQLAELQAQQAAWQTQLQQTQNLQTVQNDVFAQTYNQNLQNNQIDALQMFQDFNRDQTQQSAYAAQIYLDEMRRQQEELFRQQALQQAQLTAQTQGAQETAMRADSFANTMSLFDTNFAKQTATATQNFATTAKQAELNKAANFGVQENTPEAPEKSGLPLWAWIAIGTGAAAVVGGTAYALTRKKGKEKGKSSKKK